MKPVEEKTREQLEKMSANRLYDRAQKLREEAKGFAAILEMPGERLTRGITADTIYSTFNHIVCDIEDVSGVYNSKYGDTDQWQMIIDIMSDVESIAEDNGASVR